MLELLWLIPALPFAGFFALAAIGARLRRVVAAVIGVGSIGLSAFVALLVAASFVTSPPDGEAFKQTLWIWIDAGGLKTAIGLYLDALSLTMVLVVTCVGFLIHLYASEFMEEEEGFSRFFAYMNLFVGSMLVLVLADNLLLLYLGWEGVGLCSYLLIGFWYQEPANGAAARKAFIVTRVGDTAMAIGLFLLFTQLGTLDIQELMRRATENWAISSTAAIAAAWLLLGGAVGKSAQLPLQTWLPDAMAGPTPVSALIHAATMVTAGVYLIARTHPLFELAPPVQLAVGVIGAATLLIAGFSALTQWDIKRVLAYSTISQIGYMFLGLGAGAWPAAIFHFMTHAFFKALLFLGAGAIILALHHEHNMFKMGGLWRRLPVTFWTFLTGAAALAALPLVTAGFYSKELILAGAWQAPNGGPWLWAGGWLGALITSIYAFRMVFIVFFGELKQEVSTRPGARIHLPLVVLAILTVIGGFLGLPEFLRSALPPLPEATGSAVHERTLEIIAGLTSIIGMVIAYLLFLRYRPLTDRLTATAVGWALHRYWFMGWGFDWLYDTLLVRPYVWIARVNKGDIFELFYGILTGVSRACYFALSGTETGHVRWYATAIAMGAVIVVAMMVFL
ncbi:MAG: NADH-quinone oxidoreductase subunit L [Deltaproteobacteria bacterium]|nr:NADH-quinone oxidoreductase subunit L [Deltaproteobacteria bacterium]